jgi:hypothetical protein
MQGIQPTSLSNEELLKYSWLTGADKLSAQWVSELMLRLEEYVDAEARDSAAE